MPDPEASNPDNLDHDAAAPEELSFRGRGRLEMTPERGLPFDVARPPGAAPSGNGDPSRRYLSVEEILQSIPWDGEGEGLAAGGRTGEGTAGEGRAPQAPPRPDPTRPCRDFFSTFPWDGPGAGDDAGPGWRGAR